MGVLGGGGPVAVGGGVVTVGQPPGGIVMLGWSHGCDEAEGQLPPLEVCEPQPLLPIDGQGARWCAGPTLGA